LFLIADSKVEFNWNGSKITNPHQQGAAQRLYNRAHALIDPSNMQQELKEFVEMHGELNKEMNANGLI